MIIKATSTVSFILTPQLPISPPLYPISNGVIHPYVLPLCVHRPHTTLAAIVHGFDELDGGGELRPPVLLLPAQSLLVEARHVLDGGEEAWGVRFDEDVDEHWHEVIRGRHRLLIRHTQQVHDDGRTPHGTLQLVSRRLAQTYTRYNIHDSLLNVSTERRRILFYSTSILNNAYHVK